MQISDFECKTRAAYMVMWRSRANGEICYMADALPGVLRHNTDEIVQNLLNFGHIKPVGKGFYLTDEGVHTWAVLATGSATVNSFDDELKIWANWITDAVDLLSHLSPEKWMHPERHVDYAAHTKAVKKGWVKFEGDSQKTRLYQLTEAGLAHLQSIYQTV